MIAEDPIIDKAILESAVFSIAVSGGKDSTVAALSVNEYLDLKGHKGPRILIHSDLGSVEWKNSIVICDKLAKRMNMPLIVVKRQAGGMMERWEGRWQNNVQRYTNLSCVKLILPWSTPSMRFCTSELKTSIIARELVRRFRGRLVVTVLGIRREESPGRSKAPVIKVNKLLARKDGTQGIDWNPIIDMTTEQVFSAHKKFDFPLHEAYTTYGSTRVSCSFCIMSRSSDLVAAASCEDNTEIYRRMCELELRSCFSFQSNTWLSDVASHLLPADLNERIEESKLIAMKRMQCEGQIPKHLLFTSNWPEVVPTYQEARLLVSVRREVAHLQGFDVLHTQPLGLIARYLQLMNEKEARDLKIKPCQK